jgi:phosphate transport system substrate-binding protein
MLRSLIAIIAGIASTTAVWAADIAGAGATFPFPIYAKWADAYKKETGHNVNYQSIGSGAGIKQIQAKTVTFGASDMPLTDEQLNKDGFVQFPMVIGGNVVVYNIDGLQANDLVLTGEVVADIYLGKIAKWNDAKIAALNPKVKLPDAAINVVRRSDGSGTTFLFTRYLATVSEEWKTKVGVNAAVEWPVGVGAKGNDGVAGNVKQTKNSIGYVEYAFAKQNQIAYASLKVGDKVIKAGRESFQKDWPIAAPTFIIMYKSPVNKEQSKLALDFFKWALTNGDKMAEDLDYVPLSTDAKLSVLDTWKNIKH